MNEKHSTRQRAPDIESFEKLLCDAVQRYQSVLVALAEL